MYSLLKFFLFQQDPEKVHYRVMKSLHSLTKTGVGKQFLRKNFSVQNQNLKKELWGITFPNPVGLAAGFDKNAEYIDDLAYLGFGFIEIGTVTPKPQPGNPKPRLFRLPKDQALINRMGFNNKGVDIVIENLKKRKSNVIIGGNIGKNKTTPNENAINDYETCVRELYDYVDYFVVNVSSPNTPNLRALQEKEPLENLLSTLQKINSELGKNKPLLLKIAPDVSIPQLDDIISIALSTQINGIVATNTTISRNNLTSSTQKIEKIGAGGLSGKPVQTFSTEVIRYIHSKTKGKLTLIGVGGIFSAIDAQEKLDAGAELVQVYTGFVYKGPSIVKNICQGIASL